MANCTICGKKTNWLTRAPIAGGEVCGSSCLSKWREAERIRIQEEERRLAAARAEAAKRASEARRQELQAKQLKEEERKTNLRLSKKTAKEAEQRGKKTAKEAEQRDRRRRWQETSAPLRELIRKSPNDAKLRTELGLLATETENYAEAKKAYLAAFAIGFSVPLDEALAEWAYANVIWKAKGRSAEGRSLEWEEGRGQSRVWRRITAKSLDQLAAAKTIVTLDAQRALRLMAEDVVHHVFVAREALVRHIRGAPNDLEALRLLRKATHLLAQPEEPVRQQIELAKRRKARPTLRSAYDRTGIGFESRCLTVIRKLGFRADVTRVTADGGIDILAFSENPLLTGKCVIQCKDWSNPVGEPAVRDLLGVVAAEDAIKGILIASGGFTEAAQRFVRGKRIDLIDGRDLERMERLSFAEPQL